MWVLSFNQIDLPLPRPMLHCFLTLYREKNVGEFCVPDQSMNAVSFGETFEDTFPMLRGAANKVGCYANVKRAIGFGSEEIHGVDFVAVHFHFLPPTVFVGLVPLLSSQGNHHGWVVSKLSEIVIAGLIHGPTGVALS